ncbi:peptidoglycan DD-metalloendopeptidase family protein [Myxacorys almedinensis]|uniref:Peptidoglycan DD-metalloendopeptidase family protein n=1 Tax=Myxacorys almedinensis A TaxID=2690445 RepID=A0A8J8CJB6_9CYAN|nr:peptidoglycan DD-metalloendopeptidase family protein [Myxacorys almedinensis]NDJ18828.1 peptidoglycan DD-metalloendopeptidase family protein [Myxacorys almedinensis A]
MKRAVPQDANSVPLRSIDVDAIEDSPKQTLPEDNRRACTSAAMIGLAISVGAYGLLAPQKGDNAVAAEPTPDTTLAGHPSLNAVAQLPTTEATSSVQVPTVTQSVTIASSSQPISAHTVQDGQTLWKIAKLYGVDVARLASANSLQVNTVLDVGQVLQVPSSVQAAIPQGGMKQIPELKQVPTIPEIPVATNPALGDASSASMVQRLPKTEKVAALQTLKQNRDRLKQSLAELKSEESTTDAQSVLGAVPVAEEAQPQATVTFQSHKVQKGETLSAIAQTNGVSLLELAKLNRLSNPNLLKASQVIQIPEAEASAQAPPLPATNSPAVAIPVVPSLAATQNVDSVSAPLAIGGDAQQFAFNRAGGKAPASGSASYGVKQQDSSPYVSSLMSEIVRLREKYQGRSNAGSLKLPAKISAPPSPTVSRRVKPEFQASQSATPQREAQTVRQPASRMDALVADAPKPKDQLVATSALGSETYTPLIRSQIGKTVSPNVPPLGKSESYLPNATDNRLKGYAWPAKGVLTSGYGWRWGRMHKGIDIAAPVGTPIVASAPGKVVTSGWNDGGYGILVEIEHSDGSVTLYAHNSRTLVRVGQQVTQGEKIALMGSTGFSTGPHSHFEVHLPGRGAVNPIAHLPQNRS